MTHNHRFPSDESIEDHLCDDDVIENVMYVDDEEVVTCSKDESEGHSREELEEKGRDEVYSIANDAGVDVNWSGESADSKEEMIDKVISQEGE